MNRIVFISTFVALTACSSKDSTINYKDKAASNFTSPISSAGRPDQTTIKDGPFGIAMGQSVSDLKFIDVPNDDPTQARILSSVPKPMSELETYAVVAYPETGVCELRTISKTFESDAYGLNVKSAIDAMSDSLDAKYGKHDKDSFCTSDGSCQYFQMGLKDGSQGYEYTWSRKTGANLPKDVSEISIRAMPGEFNGTFFRLDYVSSNKEGCANARRKAKSLAL